MAETTATGAWEAALERVMARQGTVVVLGGPDTGKTTRTRELLNTAVERDILHVSLVDADIGQGEVGPPGTAALATVRAPVEALSELRAERLAFVGATSPPGHLLALATGTRRLVEEAQRRGAGLVVVDTCGLVRGPIARQLKQAVVDLVRPQSVLAIQAERELEGILRLVETSSEAEVIRLHPHPAVRLKPPGLRRARRAARFYRRFTGARTFDLSSAQVAISHGWLFTGEPIAPHHLRSASAALKTELIYGEVNEDAVHFLARGQPAAAGLTEVKEEFDGQRVVVSPAYVLQNLLVGLVEQDGNTAEVGILQGVQFQRRILTILTPLNHVGMIHQVRLGRLRLRPDGSEIGHVRPGDL